MRPRAPPTHSVTFSPVELEMHAAQVAALLLMNAERGAQLGADVVEPPRLVALGRRLGVAVHRIADPQHAGARRAHGANDARQVRVDVLRAEARDQRQAPGLVVRIQDVDQLLQVLVR